MRRLEKDESLLHWLPPVRRSLFEGILQGFGSNEILHPHYRQGGWKPPYCCVHTVWKMFGSMQYRCDYGGCERRLPAE